MSNIRSSGYRLEGLDDDESFQTLVGDVERLAIKLDNTLPKGTVIPISSGGTGANNAPQARINLGITATELGYLLAANNLSDLTSVSTARSNLGLGSMATQASSSVSITGGSVSGCDLIGGTTKVMHSIRPDATTPTFNLDGAGTNPFIVNYQASGSATIRLLSDVTLGTGHYAEVRGGSSGTSAYLDLGINLSGGSITRPLSITKTSGGVVTVSIQASPTGSNTSIIGWITQSASLVDIAKACQLGASGSTVGFFGNTGATKTSVADLGAKATTQTAGATYGSNEQTMLGNVKTDLQTLFTKVNALLDALQSYNLV